MRTAIFITFVAALFARLSFAIPPGCLLHAVNTQDEPSDLSAICGNGALEVQSYMADNCGNFEETAQKAFIDTCSSAGTSVAAYTATSTSSSRGSSSTGTATGHITSTNAQTTGSGTGSSVSSTAGANVEYKKAAMGPMAAAAVALIGAVAAL